MVSDNPQVEKNCFKRHSLVVMIWSLWGWERDALEGTIRPWSLLLPVFFYVAKADFDFFTFQVQELQVCAFTSSHGGEDSYSPRFYCHGLFCYGSKRNLQWATALQTEPKYIFLRLKSIISDFVMVTESRVIIGWDLVRCVCGGEGWGWETSLKSQHKLSHVIY